jgi:hypothetical protein
MIRIDVAGVTEVPVDKPKRTLAASEGIPR